MSWCYITNEQEKQRAYDKRVREVEKTCFTPLVFSASGGMGPSAATIYKKLASIVAEKWNMNYSRCLFWFRWQVSFSLLRSAIMCVRDHCSSIPCPVVSNVDFSFSEGRLNIESN